MMFYRRRVTKVSVFIVLALLFAFGIALAQTAEDHKNRAEQYYSQKAYDEAIAEYSKAIELKPDYAEAYNCRGDAYYYKGSYDQAIYDYSRTIEINLNNPQPYESRAMAYWQKAEYDRAWVDVHKAEQLGYKVDPDFLLDLKDASGREN
jgi:tetratricopeptide (TPR) repeat protein